MVETEEKFDLILTILEQIQEKLNNLNVKILSSEEKGSEVRSAAHTENNLVKEMYMTDIELTKEEIMKLKGEDLEGEKRACWANGNRLPPAGGMISEEQSQIPKSDDSKPSKTKVKEEVMTKEAWKIVKYDCRVLKHSEKAVNVLMDDKQQWFPKGWIVNLEEIDLEEMNDYQSFQFRWFGIVKKGLEGLFND